MVKIWSGGPGESNSLETARQEVVLTLAEKCSRKSTDGESEERDVSPTRMRELSTTRMTTRTVQELQAKAEALATLKKLHDDAVTALDETPDDERLLGILKDISADLQLLEIDVSAQQLWEHTEAVERFAGVVDLTSLQRPLEEEWKREWAGTLLKKFGHDKPGQPWKRQHMRIMRRRMEKLAKKNTTKAQYTNSNPSGQNECPGALTLAEIPLVIDTHTSLQIETSPLVQRQQQQTQLQSEVPPMYWESPSAVGNPAGGFSISDMKMGVRYYAAAGVRAVKSADGSLHVTRPGCEDGRFNTQVVKTPPVLPPRGIKPPTRAGVTNVPNNQPTPTTPPRDGWALHPSRLRPRSPTQPNTAGGPPELFERPSPPALPQALPGKDGELDSLLFANEQPNMMQQELRSPPFASPTPPRTDPRSSSSPKAPMVRMPL
jgi:hypothetical protein